MVNLYEIHQQYVEAMKRIKEIVKNLPFNVAYIMEALCLERSQYYARLSAENWEPQHMLVFAQLQRAAESIKGGQ